MLSALSSPPASDSPSTHAALACVLLPSQIPLILLILTPPSFLPPLCSCLALSSNRFPSSSPAFHILFTFLIPQLLPLCFSLFPIFPASPLPLFPLLLTFGPTSSPLTPFPFLPSLSSSSSSPCLSPECLLFSRTRMKRLACPCPALPHFWQLGSRFMAEGTGTQAPGQGPQVNIQYLRAQYEGLRRQQRTQAQLVVLPKAGNTPSPAESMISAVWINKERRSSLSLEEAALAEGRILEEADRSCVQAAESPWHTHLEMHRLAQTLYQENIHQVKRKDQRLGSDQSLPPEEAQHSLGSNQKTQQGTKIPEAAQSQCQADSVEIKAEESSLKSSIPCPFSIKNPPRPAKPDHYPFPQRKPPRISQAARNLGLYGPV